MLLLGTLSCQALWWHSCRCKMLPRHSPRCLQEAASQTQRGRQHQVRQPQPRRQQLLLLLLRVQLQQQLPA